MSRNSNFALAQAFIMTLSLCLGTIMLVAMAHRDDASYEVNKDRQSQQITFYRIAGGEISGSGTGPDLTLARDLDEWVEEGRDIQDFRGNSNRYGGVSDALGFDPFDSSGLGCFECGPLNDEAIAEINSVRETGETLIEPLQPPKQGSWWAMAAGVWLIGGPLSLYAVSSGFSNAYFQFSNILSTNKIPLATKVMTGPLYLLVEVPYRIRKRRHEHSLRSAFPEQMQTLDEVDGALALLKGDNTPGTEVLESMRHEVVLELERQASSTKTSEQDLDDLMEKLDQTRSWLQHRHEYLHKES